MLGEFVPHKKYEANAEYGRLSKRLRESGESRVAMQHARGKSTALADGSAVFYKRTGCVEDGGGFQVISVAFPPEF
jgi:hypothetical protein